MRLIEFLRDPAVAEIYLHAALAAIPVVLACGVLSVIVVVKRLGFVGQGVSHSAFGGIGVAALLAALGMMPVGAWESAAQMMVVLVFCIGAALGMAAVSDRRTVPVDTAIGMFLVGSMAVGAVLVQVARGIAEGRGRVGMVQSWESILFGSITASGPADIRLGFLIAALVLGAAWWFRRPMMFWCFDEESATAFGVPTRGMKTLLLVLLALAVVTAMKLAGVILATALLVLPGATALKLTDRLRPALAWSCGVGMLSLFGGLVLSIETDWQAGPSVVLVLLGLFALAMGLGAVRRAGA